MQYCHLHEDINTGDDAATFCKNLMSFGAVTPEITFLIRVTLYAYWAKIGLLSPFVILAFANALDD